jgi:type VI protein secretion system component VasK
MSDSPHKVYRRNRTRWIATAIFVTLCTCVIGLWEESGRVSMVWVDCARSVTIVCWLIAAMVWCTHRLIEEQRRRETRTVNHVRDLIVEQQQRRDAYAALVEESAKVRSIRRG